MRGLAGMQRALQAAGGAGGTVELPPRIGAPQGLGGAGGAPTQPDPTGYRPPGRHTACDKVVLDSRPPTTAEDARWKRHTKHAISNGTQPGG